ncbi:hypothetical protein [Flavobacterium sp. 3-210]
MNKQFLNPEEWIVVLGSGASINNLTEDLKNWANKTRARIAINKYGAFYEKAGIIPTDIYFHDFHDKTSEYFFYETINRTKSVATTYYVSPISKEFITKSFFSFSYLFFRYIIILNRAFLKKISRKLIKPFSKNKHDRILSYLDKFNQRKPLLLNKRHEIYNINVHYLWDLDNVWANTLDEELFHFRGSLTSVLNLVSIKYPKLNVLMLGVDLATKEYFFDEEIEVLYKITGLGYDWTQAFMDSSGKHYSAAIDSGVTIFDRFNYVVECLDKSENKIFAYPKENALMFNGLVNSFVL